MTKVLFCCYQLTNQSNIKNLKLEYMSLAGLVALSIDK
jgi:hypothetical protein